MLTQHRHDVHEDIEAGRWQLELEDRRQNGAGPRPASDINTWVARTGRVPVTVT
jgi:hypothetical protein